MADVPPALARYARWRAIDAKLHSLWTKAVGQDGYLRREWEDFAGLLQQLAREGLGPPDGSNGGLPGGDDPTIPNGEPIH